MSKKPYKANEIKTQRSLSFVSYITMSGYIVPLKDILRTNTDQPNNILMSFLSEYDNQYF